MFREPTDGDTRPPVAAEPSPPGERSIFRAHALDRYLKEQEKAVLPRLVSPRSFTVLWIVAGVLLALAAGILFWPGVALRPLGVL